MVPVVVKTWLAPVGAEELITTVVPEVANPVAAVAVAALPPIFKPDTGVAEVTVNGAVPVATVETNVLPEIAPVEVMEPEPQVIVGEPEVVILPLNCVAAKEFEAAVEVIPVEKVCNPVND